MASIDISRDGVTANQAVPRLALARPARTGRCHALALALQAEEMVTKVNKSEAQKIRQRFMSLSCEGRWSGKKDQSSSRPATLSLTKSFAERG